MSDFDFGTIDLDDGGVRPINPLDIFANLQPRDPNLKNLWLEQGDALRAWHQLHRDKEDVAILLNTGAGKTLVGLLCAQSLVNETRTKVLYLCTTRQLVEQTVMKAAEYGMPVTYYLDRSFSNDLYGTAKAPCITTYHAIFNGLARRFQADPASAYIFDDAHTAGDIIRDCYTLDLTAAAHSTATAALFALFRPYFRSIDRVVRYDELSLGRGGKHFELIPPFIVHDNIDEMRRLLISSDLGHDSDQMFAWNHLCEHLDLCAVFACSGRFSFTPPFVPTRLHYALSTAARRLYLSATLRVEDSFVRTFGRHPIVIRSTTSAAGQCERMILVPSKFKNANEELLTTKALIAPYKALVSVPTYSRANEWSGVADVVEDNAGPVLEAFKVASDSRKLVLVARYDGVDLPDDACRVMVIDDLPAGIGLIERFMFEKLGLLKSLRSAISSRIVQCFGRISRGTRDHGVFFVTGEKLVDWLQNPTSAAFLPLFLRKQLKIGLALSSATEDMTRAATHIERCLDRKKADKWVAWYQKQLEGDRPEEEVPADPALVKGAEIEIEYGELLWGRRYDAASTVLAGFVDDAFVLSQRTGAWYAMWLAYCYELYGDTRASQRFYERAMGAAPNILFAPRPVRVPERAQLSEQAQAIDSALNYVDQRAKMDKLFSRMGVELSALGGGSPSQVTVALKQLGFYLGLNSSRPDDEGETGGPDVCWYLSDGVALCIEAKTDKARDGCYNKKELGQFEDHTRWAKIHLEAADVKTVFVGPFLPACERTNPDERFRGIELTEFKNLGERVGAAIRDVAQQRSPLMFASEIHRVFEERGLMFPHCVESLAHFDIRLASPAQ